MPANSCLRKEDKLKYKNVITTMDATTVNCIELDLLFLTFVVFQQFYPLLFALFLICKLVPPTGLKMNDLGSKINGTAVSLQIWNSYFDKADTRPTFVCSKPNFFPRTKNKRCKHISYIFI
jgi:hypothetical protein